MISYCYGRALAGGRSDRHCSLCAPAYFATEQQVLSLGNHTSCRKGWRITPAGTHIPLMGDFPSRIISAKDGTHILVLTSGFHNHGVTLIDTKSKAVISSLNLDKAYGDMALDDISGRLYVTAGGAAVLRGAVQQNRLAMQIPIGIPDLTLNHQYATGVAIARDKSLFVVNINNDSVYKLSPQTYAVAATARSGYGAYRATLSPDGNVLAVSNWGDESVSLFAACQFEAHCTSANRQPP